MSPKKSLLDRIDVREPCTESWQEMTGNDEVRFCSHCSKNVYDLSAYTRTRAETLVRNSNGGLCVRYRKDERGQMITAPPRLTQIKRQAKIAAGVLATTMSVASMAYTQGSPRPAVEKPGFEKREKDPNALPGFVVSGVITDVSGAVVPNAEVTLVQSLRRVRVTTKTNQDGQYRFVDVEPGQYDLEVTSPGFAKSTVEELNVAADLQTDVVLQVGETTTGLLVIEGEPIACDDPPTITDKIETRKIVDLPPAARTFTMGLIPVIAEKPENKNPDKKSKKKLPK